MPFVFADKSRQSKAKAIAAVVVIVSAFSAGVALAQKENRQIVRQACASDYQSLCSGVQPGGGRIIACLQQNEPKLSPECRQALQTAKGP